ncbi:hypothetical protein DL546_007618 [Coniochaeta pulveracea]|uniref:DUF7728 domain-containing protein n=1 Tax=Coniochaeta pulveracea TaxID=177199 RepID=A0A420YC31_9PEZI|nr:hypothetical protein DL546_007618 [Coniochaeta pulveracea]
MLLKPFLAVAGLTAATQAFLLPPDISKSDVDISNFIPEVIASGSSHHVDLPCPGCLGHHKGNRHGYSKTTEPPAERPVHLELSFDVRPKDKDHKADRLVVVTGTNNEMHEIYPNPMSDHSPLIGHLAFDKPSEIEKKLRGHRSGARYRNKPLGYAMTAVEQPLTEGDGLQMIDLDFQIIKVGDKFIKDIPAVCIKLIKDTATGALVIGNIEQAAPKTESAIGAYNPEDCTSFLCKWLAAVHDKVEKAKMKCGGKAKTGSQPHPSHGHKMDGPHHKPLHHVKGDDRDWNEFGMTFAKTILLPVAVGIIAGLAVSMIGMMVGTLIVSVWRLFRRSSDRRNRSHSHLGGPKAPTEEVVSAEANEKAGLMENQEEQEDAPPAYEDNSKDIAV